MRSYAELHCSQQDGRRTTLNEPHAGFSTASDALRLFCNFTIGDT
jgi:hypothetical protein